jgi:CRISPR-associated protein Cas1
MNPILISGYGDSITVNRVCLTVSNADGKTDTITFEPHQISYDSIIIDGHCGNISFEAIRWLMKHDVLVSVLNWNGNLLSTILPKETNNGKLRIKQYQAYLDKRERLMIANSIIREKLLKTENMLRDLSKCYQIGLEEFNKEMTFKTGSGNQSITDVMMHEGRIASIYWS